MCRFLSVDWAVSDSEWTVLSQLRGLLACGVLSRQFGPGLEPAVGMSQSQCCLRRRCSMHLSKRFCPELHMGLLTPWQTVETPSSSEPSLGWRRLPGLGLGDPFKGVWTQGKLVAQPEVSVPLCARLDIVLDDVTCLSRFSLTGFWILLPYCNVSQLHGSNVGKLKWKLWPMGMS